MMSYQIGTSCKPMVLETPPLVEALGLAEVKHDAKGNKMNLNRTADDMGSPKVGLSCPVAHVCLLSAGAINLNFSAFKTPPSESPKH